MLYQSALRTTVPQRIRHKDPYAAAEHERLEEHATQSAANHDRTGCHRKAPLYAGQSVSVINNDRTLWLPVTIVHTADHGSYIVRVIGGSESLVEQSIDGHETTFVNVTQMLSSLTCTPRLKWLNNLSPLHQPQKLYSYSKHLLLPQYNHLCSHNTQASCSPKPYSSNPHPVEDTCNHRCSTTNRQN